MIAGISTATLFNRLYNEDALALFAEWKIAAAEVFYTSFSEYEPSFSEMLNAKRGDLFVNSFHVLNTQFEPQLYNAHPRVKADSFSLLDKVLTSSRILGAKNYTFHGLARIKRTFREDVPRTAELTREIAEHCERFGVSLCLENVEWAFYNRPGLFREIKARCPKLKGVLDIKQTRISGYDNKEYLREMGGAISHVHVSDITADGKLCLAGRGSFDFDELFRMLRGEGFTGAAIIENYAGDYKDLGELKSAYDFLAEKSEKYS